MQLQIKWNLTGDHTIFDVINPELARWFVSTSGRHGNRYSLGTQVIDQLTRPTSIDNLIAQEINYIEKVNQALTKYKVPLKFELPTDWYDQHQLNCLHKTWAQSRLNMPRLSEFFYKVDPVLFEAYQEMNCHIHLIENSMRWVYRDSSNWRTDNPFADQYFEWHQCHLHLMYPGHGRTAFEKFQFYDDGEDWQLDNVNWDNIDSYIELDLASRPHRVEPPPEFIDWCKQKNLVPHNKYLPLANVQNWQQELPRARQVAAQNAKITDNYFVLELLE